MRKISKVTLSILYILFGVTLGITGVILGYIWFGWKLMLVLLFLQWSNNISNRLSNK